LFPRDRNHTNPCGHNVAFQRGGNETVTLQPRGYNVHVQAGPCWASARAEALSYSAVKLFSENSNLCVADT